MVVEMQPKAIFFFKREFREMLQETTSFQRINGRLR